MKSDRKLVAHLMRRAGFGATPQELDHLTSTKSYEEIVEDLTNPEKFDPIDMSYVERYYTGEPVACLLYTSPSPRDKRQSRMPSSA